MDAGGDRVEDRLGRAGGDGDLGLGIVGRPYDVRYIAAIASRSASTPGIGAYWLRPSRMCRATASTSSGSQSKSGNPCDRLIAPTSAASCDITVKMVVPTDGSRDSQADHDVIRSNTPARGSCGLSSQGKCRPFMAM